jgi:hypothetical protein
MIHRSFDASMARRVATLVSFALLAACARETPAPSDSAATRPAVSAAPAVQPASVSPAQLAALGWLAGRWRGALPDGAPFFEAYAIRDSVTIAKYDYPDATFATPSDSGVIALRGDTLFSGSPGMQWVATSIDSARVVFAPWRGARNGFTWQREADGWTATITWDSAGTPKQRVYQMRAVP